MSTSSPRGVKINRAPPTTTIPSTFGDGFCQLITSSNYCHTLSIMDPNSEMVMVRREMESPRKFRPCLQIDSVCMNKHQHRKTSPHLHTEWGEAHSPFSVAGSSTKLALQLSEPLLITIIISICITVAVKAPRTSCCSVKLHPAFHYYAVTGYCYMTITAPVVKKKLKIGCSFSSFLRIWLLLASKIIFQHL